MPRTRVRTATKPATRSAPKPTIVRRPSSASSLEFLSQASEREDTPASTSKRRKEAGHERDDPNAEEEVKDIKVKQEPYDTDTETKKKQAKTKKRTTKEPDTTAPTPKKRKPSPPTTRTRTHRRSPPKAKKNPIITPRSSISSDESEYSEPHKLKAELERSPPSTQLPLNNTTMTMLPYLDLLRPYMAFQLSLSGLSGKAYKTAQASMTELIDVVDRLKGTTEHYGFGREVRPDEGKTAVNRRDGNGVVLVNKRKEEESIVARKLRELEDHVGVDSETHYDTDSSNSDDDTPVGSDEDEADALEHRSPSISSATTGYESNYSSTDSAESSSYSGEDTDAIERRERNALRRRKAQQKRRTERMREMDSSDAEGESESEAEVHIEISKEDRQEMERVALLQRACTKPLVAFSPVAW